VYEIYSRAILDYVLTREDILHARHRTAGINQRDIMLDGAEVSLLDVGGTKLD